MKSDIVQDEVAPVPGSHGTPIRDLILTMLEPDAARRPTATELLGLWQGIFTTVARQVHALDDRVF